LANSIAPTAAVKSVAPPAMPRGPFWQIVGAAAAMVALGVGLSQLQQREPSQPEAQAGLVVRSTAASQPAPAPLSARAPEGALRPQAQAPEPVRQETVVVAEVAAANKAEVEQAPPVAPQVEAAAPAVVASKREARAERVKRVDPRARKSGKQLAAHPSREQVVSAMKTAMPALSQCTGGRKGSVSAQLTVRSSGQVSYALIQGSFAGTPEGSCLARALRDVRFPPFAEPSLRLTYPLQF
jgi:type IV secretory pathway VirB10-like protein